MNRIIFILIFILLSISGAAQVNVNGVVIENGTNEPLTGASVILRDANGKIKKFATTDADGKFSIAATETAGYTIDVSMMSFAKRTIKLDGATFPITVTMTPSVTVLKEVAVKADKIREQGDTVTYLVGSFAQKQDRSIGDVLRRMPGIDVSKSGKIQYQGEAINKFYIEGSDLLGGKYGIATNGINHEDVGAVEVMENHQPMQVLTGLAFSEKAAINLKLKNKAKATWNVHGTAGTGYSWNPEGLVWDGELFAMAVMPSFQNITTVKTNNTGENITSQMTDFFANQRGTGLNNIVNVSLPSVPSLNSNRTLFNRSAILSTNSLWKLKSGEVKAQFDYSFNRVTSEAANITTYYLSDGDKIITENRDGRDRKHSLSGKVIYEVNHKTTFINNTLQTNIDWDDIRLRMSGSIPNSQTVSLPDYYVGNKFKMIKRFGGRNLVTFNSDNEWEALPQTLRVSAEDRNAVQHVGNHAFYTNESVAYSFSVKGVTIGLEGGIKGYIRSMNSTYTDMETTGDINENVINTNYVMLYATPKAEYWIKKFTVTLNAPVSVAYYTFDKSIANRSETYFSPSLSFNWKPNNRYSLGVSGKSGRSPMSLSMIRPDYIMTDYRSFNRGVDDFYNSTSQSVSGNASYKNTRTGLFANARVSHTWNHLPYTMEQEIYGDYIAYSYSTAKSDSKSTMALASIGKTLGFINGSFNINGMYQRSSSRLITDSRFVDNVSNGWMLTSKISGGPTTWLSFDYAINYSASRLTMNGISASWIGNLKNSLLLNIMPVDNVEWHISGEHYRNEMSSGDYKNVFLIDTKLIYKLNKRIEISGNLTNILNKKSYNYITYNQLSSFESQRQLRGREFLISITLRK